MALLVAELIGEPLLDAAARSESTLRQHGRRLMRWLRRAAQPPDGLELTSRDGSTYSGVLVAEDNRVVMGLMLRHRASPPSAPPATGRIGANRDAPPHPLFHDIPDPHDPRWDRDINPFGG